MKKNILLAVVLLSSGLQMAAKDRDLIGMREFKKLAAISYDSLTPKEKEQVIFMAFRSGLQDQFAAARRLLNNKFKLSNQEWKTLENMATNKGLDAVNTYFANKLSGGLRTPSPAGAPAQVVQASQPQPIGVPEAPQALQLVAVVPQALQELVDEMANLTFEFSKTIINKQDLYQGLLADLNKGDTEANLKAKLQNGIDDIKTSLSDTKTRIAEYKTELAALGIDKADIEKVYTDAFNTGGYNQAAHDLLVRLQNLQIAGPNPLSVVPSNVGHGLGSAIPTPPPAPGT